MKLFIKDIITNLIKEIKEINQDIKQIEKNKIIFFLWFLLLPFNFILTIFIIVLTIFFYFKYLIKLIYYYFKIKFKNNKKKIILKNSKEKIIIINNIYLIFLKHMLINQSDMKAYTILYDQINILKNLNNNNNKENLKIIISKLIFRYLFIIITNIPLIVFKNNNFIIKNIQDINRFKKTKFTIKLNTLMYNLIIKYNGPLSVKSKQSKIIITYDNIILNVFEKDIINIKNLKNLKDWVKASEILANKGSFANLKYELDSNSNFEKKLKPHSSLFYYNNEDNQIFISNQTTNQYLKFLKEKEEFLIKNKNWQIKNNNNLNYEEKIKLKLEMDALFIDQKKAFMTTPHIVNLNNVEIKTSKNLIKILNKKEKIGPKFLMTQSFLINLKEKILIFDEKKGLKIWNDYINIEDYIIKNSYKYDIEIKENLFRFIEFFNENRNYFEEKQVEFMTIINKAQSDLIFRSKFFWLIENLK